MLWGKAVKRGWAQSLANCPAFDETQAREVVTVIKCFLAIFTKLMFFNSKKSYIFSGRLYCMFLWNLFLLQMGVLFIIIWNCYWIVILHSMKLSLWSKLDVGCVGCSPSWRFLAAFLLVRIYSVYLPVLWKQFIFKISSNAAFWKTSFLKKLLFEFYSQ